MLEQHSLHTADRDLYLAIHCVILGLQLRLHKQLFEMHREALYINKYNNKCKSHLPDDV